jgi:hypothetical protein
MSDLSTNFNSGYHVQGSLYISPPLLPIGFRVDGTYDNFAAKTTNGVTSGSSSLAGLSGNVVYGLGGLIVGPYVLAGVGYYHSSASINNSNAVTGNNPGFNIGAGLKFGIGDLGATAEARYVIVSTSNNSLGATNQPSAKFVPITFGISF